jgi:selenocysteine lyase/cysteine desulfurase
MGFAYVRRAWSERLDPPFLSLQNARWAGPARYEVRPDARRFESWETSFAAKVGFGVAVDYALAWGLDAIWARIATLAARLRAALDELPEVETHDLGRERCGIVTFSVAGVEPGTVRQALAAMQINVSVAARDYTPLDMAQRASGGLVRASVHYYNTEEEIARFCAAVADVATGRVSGG